MKLIQKKIAILLVGLIIYSISDAQLYCPDPVFASLNIMHLRFGNTSLSIDDEMVINEDVWIYAVKYDEVSKELKCLGRGLYPGGGPLTMTINGQDDFDFGFQNGDTLNFIFETNDGCLAESYFVDQAIVFEGGTVNSVNEINIISNREISLAVENGLCEEESAVISVSPPNWNIDFDYTWSNGDTISSIENLQNGEYWLEATNDFGCVYFSDTVSVFNNEEISVEISLESPNSNNCLVELEIDGGTGPFDTSWSNGDIGETTTIQNGEEITFTVIDSNNCQLDSLVSCMTTSVDYLLGPFFLSPIPNPIYNDFIEIELSLPNIQAGKICITSNLGTVVKSFDFKAQYLRKNIFINDLQSGIYYLNIIANDQNLLKKLMIQ